MRKLWRKLLIILGSLIGTCVLVVAVYVTYVMAQYHRIEDNVILNVRRDAQKVEMSVDTEYSISTYNLGFGAYSPDFSFFMDEGYMKDGKKVTGHYGKALSKEKVLYDTEGAIRTIQDLSPDIALFQEVDTNSDRSYHVDQNDMIFQAFGEYDAVHAVNFHSAYLFYPFHDPHGKSNSGITTLSQFKIQSSVRRSFPVSGAFPDKFFDLDRCFSVSNIQVENGKTLTLVNLHMSAYDKGGTIRNLQMQMLASFLEECAEKEDYVIVGGDFNHDLLINNPAYSYTKENFPFKDETEQTKPDWLQFFFEDSGESPLPEGFRVIASDNTSTCRGSEMVWTPGVNYVTVVDGFIVSDNIEVVEHQNIVTSDENAVGYAYSDHQPAWMKFILQ